MLRSILTGLALLYLLTACTSLPEGPQTAVDLPGQLERLNTVTKWKINGKMAIREYDEAVSANLNWKTDGTDFSFRLTNVLGVTMVDLQSNESGATLTADDKIYTDQDPSALIFQVTGWDIPVTPLLSWVKGLPLRGDDYQLGENNLLTQLIPGCQQCGQWVVNYSNYGHVDGIWLPHALTLVRPLEPDVRIKIRIDKWTLQ